MTATYRGPVGAVIVAAGSGERFGDPGKALVPLAGRPMLAHAIELFSGEPAVAQIVVVLGEHTLEAGAMLLAALRPRDVSICTGGATRALSVRAGVERIDPEIGLVAVHDAARPLATRALLRRVVAAARDVGAAAPGIAVSDTIVVVDSGRVVAAPDRATLRAVQTPQVARREWLLAALATQDDATDESSLLHRAGYPVVLVEGEPSNVKVTYPDDIERAERLLATMAEQR